MKKFIYGLFGKLGYRVENRNKRKAAILQKISVFEAAQGRPLLYRAHQYIEKLQAMYPDLAIADHKEGVLVSFAGYQFYIESNEEFFILNEVFVEKDYNFSGKGNYILIDIGANIGISSLFFSRNPQVEKIYAFEPVEDTYNQAVYNFSLNESGVEIVISNFGLGENERKETFIFNRQIKGNTGIRGKLSASYAATADLEERDVQIRDVAMVFDEIRKENPGRKIAVKMDCEGAEYEIMQRLAASGLLEQTDVFLIEWHDKGAEALENDLRKAGFFLFSRQLAHNSGMIYALRN